MVKFGFGTLPMDLNSTLSLISYAETLGYDYAWMPDQTFYRDPLVMLGVIALNTTKIQLGVGVTNPYTRHPAITARAVATVDELSGGRMNLGIGAGNGRELLRPLGFERKHAATMCRDAAIIARSLFKGEKVTYGGKVVAKGVKLSFKARSDIPIYIAGQGSKILEASGEVADGAIIGSLITQGGLDYAFSNINKGAKKSGRSIKDIDIVSWVGCAITDEKKDFIRRRKPGVARILGEASVKTLRQIGIEEEVIEAVKQAYAKGGRSNAAKYVPDEAVEKINVVGTAQECADKIGWLFHRGVDQFALLTVGCELDSIKKTIEKFATEVISRFR